MADDDVPSSKSLALRIQGKLASKMSTKGLAKQVVDGPTSDLIDNCYRIAKNYLGNKKEAEKIMKDMIKIVVKVALLSRNHLFTPEEIQSVQQFQMKFKTIAITVISFHEVDFTFDCDYLLKNFQDSKVLLQKCVKAHLTDKSLKRIDHVFSFFSNADMLEEVFKPSSNLRQYLTNIVAALNILIEQGEL